MLSICRYSLVLYTAGSGVNSVQIVLSGLSMKLLTFGHVCDYCRYGCMYALAAFLLMCINSWYCQLHMK